MASICASTSGAGGAARSARTASAGSGIDDEPPDVGSPLYAGRAPVLGRSSAQMTERPAWQKCSICKKPIEYGAQYLKCVVSTCNRKRFQLYFCSDECWDAHNPDQNHRNPGYTEHFAPKAP